MSMYIYTHVNITIAIFCFIFLDFLCPVFATDIERILSLAQKTGLDIGHLRYREPHRWFSDEFARDLSLLGLNVDVV